MTNDTARLIEKTCKHTGKDVWAVEFADKSGRILRTSWTTIREEACAWGRNIQITGWTTEGRPLPALDANGARI